MATLKQIQFKRTKLAGSRPTAAQLAEGELAINMTDRLLFTKDENGNIIDLGFAKGGNIDGDVVQIGNYNQTGDYTLLGNFYQTGDYNLSGTARVTRDIIAAGKIVTEAGEFITKSSGTSHLRFHDNNDRERGIIFSPANDGLSTQVVNIRVQDYTAGTENTYAFNGSGIFTAPEVAAWKSISSPQVLTNKVITNNKSIGDYDIYSMADNVPLVDAETAINHLRVMRNATGAGIFHEVKDNDGITWYAGDGLDAYLWSFTWSGGLKAGHSLSIATPGGTKGYSEMGIGSIALGDNDTGLKWHQDGMFFTVSNGTRTLLTTPTEVTTLRKLVAGYSDDGINLTHPHIDNYALSTVVTYHDNNAVGDGQTLLGYWAGDRYHHFFRGRGITNINTAGGLLVTPGKITINGQENASSLEYAPYTSGNSNVDPIVAHAWGNTFITPGGDRKNVYEISDGQWMMYLQRKTDNSVEMNVNGGFESAGVTVGNRGVHTTGEISTAAVNGLRIWNEEYGAIFRRSEDALHIIPTEHGQGKHGDIGPLRPLTINLADGHVVIPDLRSNYNSFAENGYIKFSGHGAGAGGYDIQYAQAAPIFQEIDDDAASKYYPIVKQKFLNRGAVWSLGTEIDSGTFVIHHLNEDGTGGFTSRFNKDGTVNFPDNVQIGGGEATVARNGNIFSEIWKGFNSAGTVTNLLDAVGTRVSKEGDTMTGPLWLNTPDAALVLNSPLATNSAHIRCDTDGTNNWYIGKGGESNAISFYSYKSASGIDISDNGQIMFNPQSFNLVQMSQNRMYVNGIKWVDTNPGAINIQYGLEAPIFVELGDLNGNVYYPMVKCRSASVGYGFNTSVEMGQLRTGTNAWGIGCIIVRSAENTPENGHPAAVYQFDANGNFSSPAGIYSNVNMGIGTIPVWGGPSLAIGDNDTGIVWESDGIYNLYANGMGVFSIRPGLAQTFGDVAFHCNAGMYCRDNLDVNDVYIRSDRRAKSDIKLIENAQEKSKLLGGYTYLLRNTESGEEKRSAGLIAQEVQDVLPELVTADKDTGYLRLNYNGIIGLNTATINEHTDEIKELKDEIEEFKSEIAELKALVKSLLK